MMDASRWQETRRLFEQVLVHVEGMDHPLNRASAWLTAPERQPTPGPDIVSAVVDLLRAHLTDHDALPSPVPEHVVASLLADHDRALDELAAGDRVDKYRIVRPLGRGGMGMVYLAERDDGNYAQQIALKLVGRDSPGHDLPQRLRNERQILAGLNHPNIARLLDGGPSDRGPYLAMEFVDGEPIDIHCHQQACSLQERLRLFLTACDAVQYSHNNLVVHRDLKPAHILITTQGRVKLLDFGVAGLLDPDSSTSERQRHVTPEYAAPEQLSDEPVTTSADVYALGRILSRLVDGCPGASWLRSDLKAVEEKATATHPNHRYETVAQLADDVTRAMTSRTLVARPHSPVDVLRRFSRRNLVPAAAGALVVLTLLAGLLATWNQARIAEHRFDQVRALSNTMLSDLHDAIRDLPGATSARQLLAQRAVAYLDTLSATGREDIEAELALGYEQVGEILGNPHYMNLGDLAAAMESYEHALAIRERAFERDTSDANARLALAESMGQTAVLTSWNEDNAGAIVMSTRALELLDGMPCNTLCEHVSGRIRSELGWWLIWEGRADQGLRELDASTVLLELLVAAQPEDVDIRLDLWRAYSYQVDGLRFTGRAQEALDLVEDVGLPLLLETRLLAPLHPRTLYGLHVAHDYVGNLHSTLGRHEEAAQAHATSLVFARMLVEADPRNQKAHEAMARTQSSRGNVLARLERTEEAIEAFESSISTRERLFNENPLNASLGNSAAAGHKVLCRTLIELAMPDRAADACRRAITLQQRVVAVSKGSPILIGNLGSTYAYMARADHARARTTTGAAADSLIRSATMWYRESLTTLDGISTVMEEYSFEIHPDSIRAEYAALALEGG